MLRDEEKIIKKKNFLKFVSESMCEGGTIIFVQCMVGYGEDEEKLKKWLKNKVGNNIDLELFETNVRWCRQRVVEAKQ